jgi:hypothetical protein
MGRRKKNLDTVVLAEMPEINTTLEAEIIAGEKQSQKSVSPEGEEETKRRSRKSKLDSLFSDEIIGELLGYPFEVMAENFSDERFKLKASQKQIGYLVDATAQQANFRPSEYPHVFLMIFLAYLGFEKFWVFRKYHSNGHSQSQIADNGKVGERQNDIYQNLDTAN